MSDKVTLTIELPEKLVAFFPAIAIAGGARDPETAEEESAIGFYEYCEAIYKDLEARGKAPFGEQTAMLLIGNELVDEARNTVFEAVIDAIEARNAQGK